MCPCRRGGGAEQPGPGALRVDPEGARLCAGPRPAGGRLPEEALRVRHQDPHEDPGAEPPHPLLRQEVSPTEPCDSVWHRAVMIPSEVLRYGCNSPTHDKSGPDVVLRTTMEISPRLYWVFILNCI